MRSYTRRRVAAFAALYLAGLALLGGILLGAVLARAEGPCAGLSGIDRKVCACRVQCGGEGVLMHGRCECRTEQPRGTNCRADADCIGHGGVCSGGVCRYPDGGAK